MRRAIVESVIPIGNECGRADGRSRLAAAEPTRLFKEPLDWFAIAAAIVAAQILGLAVGIDGIMGSLNGR
jgi:hypothetical protein